MMNVTKPFKSIEKKIANKRNCEGSVTVLISPSSKKLESMSQYDTFVYHKKSNQEICDTKNLFNYIEQKTAKKPKSAEGKFNRKNKNSEVKSFKYGKCQTPSDLSDESPCEYPKANIYSEAEFFERPEKSKIEYMSDIENLKIPNKFISEEYQLGTSTIDHTIFQMTKNAKDTPQRTRCDLYVPNRKNQIKRHPMNNHKFIKEKNRGRKSAMTSNW